MRRCCSNEKNVLQIFCGRKRDCTNNWKMHKSKFTITNYNFIQSFNETFSVTFPRNRFNPLNSFSRICEKLKKLGSIIARNTCLSLSLSPHNPRPARFIVLSLPFLSLPYSRALKQLPANLIKNRKTDNARDKDVS